MGCGEDMQICDTRVDFKEWKGDREEGFCVSESVDRAEGATSWKSYFALGILDVVVVLASLNKVTNNEIGITGNKVPVF